MNTTNTYTFSCIHTPLDICVHIQMQDDRRHHQGVTRAVISVIEHIQPLSTEIPWALHRVRNITYSLFLLFLSQYGKELISKFANV
jgi:hypothetical protein